MLKRLLDLIFSGAAMILLSPLLLPIALLLKLTGEGEIFYSQQRVGREEKIFYLMKFATMLKDSPNLPGGDITIENDPRLMPMGKFLRKTKINELPQLWNIFKGEMSLVGPRPLTPRNFEMYPPAVRQEIKLMKPGLTGAGSIYFRDEEAIIAKSGKPALDCYIDDIAPYKGRLELWYKKNQSFCLDLKLILITLLVVIYPGSSVYQKFISDLPSASAEFKV